MPYQRLTNASLWLRGCYWWYFAAISCFAPYAVLYYRRLGLSGPQIGVLAGTLPLGTAILAPIWGTFTDTFSAHRAVLRTALITSCFVAIAITRTTAFVPLLLLISLLAGSTAAVPALLDSYAMTMAEQEGRSYGTLRVWGSLGYIIAVWVVGWKMSTGISTFFLLAYAGSLLLTFAATAGLPALQMTSTQPMIAGVGAILRDRAVMLLLLTTYLVSSNAAIMNNYLGIYLTEIGGNTRLVGTASALAAISELPVLLYGSWLLRRWSAQRVLRMAIAIYMLRFVLYGIPPTPSWVLGVQLLHGLSFGANLIASVTLIHSLAGRQRAATAQGLLAAMSFGCGSITGSLIGGLLLDRIGAVGIFRLGAVGMLVALIVWSISIRRMIPTAPQGA
ncbi:MAG: MFS transporter [Herpetosiphon sp.]